MAKQNDKQKSVATKPAGKPEPATPPTQALSPWRAFDRDVERFFREFPLLGWSRWRDLEPLRFARELNLQAPTVDMYEEDGEIVVKAELPGIGKDDLDITLTDSTLTMKGEKKREEEIKEKDFYRCEREFGSFVRTIQLPAEVASDGVKAQFKDGLLEIRLPKSERAKSKQVHVKVQ